MISGVAAAAAAVAVWLGMPRDGVLRTRRPVTVPAWLVGRPGAMAVRVRVVAGAGVGLAAWLSLPGLVGPPIASTLALCCLPATVITLGRLEPGRVLRARERERSEAPQAMELLASCLSAGSPLRVAVAEVARVSGPEVAATLGRIVSLVGVGVPDAAAWSSLSGHLVWGPAARDIARSAGSGSAVAGLLTEHAAACRSVRRREAEQRARTVGVRSVGPLMCCFLPAFLLVGVVPLIAGTVLGLMR